jgi:hypothetical protein
MFAKTQKKFILVLAVTVLFLGCRGRGGLADSAEGVAYQYLRQLYHLNFENIGEVAAGEALMTAALLQGRLSDADDAVIAAYRQLDILITDVRTETNHTVVIFKVTDSMGESVENSITLDRAGGRWKVYTIQKSPLPQLPSFYHK